MPMAQWMAWVMKNARRQAGATSTSTSDVKLDWSLNTGGTGSVIGYPAKFSFDVSASNCSDVIYFTVNQNGGATTPNVIAITNAVCRLPGQSAEPDADGEVRAPAAVRHRHLADAQPGRDGALRVRVADLGQRRADSARDQRQQHHDEPRRLQFHYRRLDLGAHAGGADRHGDERAAVRS